MRIYSCVYLREHQTHIRHICYYIIYIYTYTVFLFLYSIRLPAKKAQYMYLLCCGRCLYRLARQHSPVVFLYRRSVGLVS